MMDLNDALHTCRCGGFIRDDANMAPEWKIKFVPDDNPKNRTLPLHQRYGNFYYVRPNGEDAHVVLRFSEAHKASYQWRTAL